MEWVPSDFIFKTSTDGKQSRYLCCKSLSTIQKTTIIGLSICDLKLTPILHVILHSIIFAYTKKEAEKEVIFIS